MADQKRWFKLWCSAPGDDDLLALPAGLRWSWAALGCYTKEHGTKGTVKVSETNVVLAGQMGVPIEALKNTILMLPHLSVNEVGQRNGSFVVTWANWHKYQEDSTTAQRQQSLRSKRRGEEKRRDKNKISKDIFPATPPKPSAENDFKPEDRWLVEFLTKQPLVQFREVELEALLDAQWWERTALACHGIDRNFIEKEFAKMGNWLATHRGRRPTKRFIQSWLCRAGEPQ